MMRLGEILSERDDAELAALAKEHVPERVTVDALLRVDLESVLRSFRFVQDALFRRQPPTFSVVHALLESPAAALGVEELTVQAGRETESLCALIDSGEILARDDGLRLYRRILYEAWRTDLSMDASEVALLGVMRRELGISQVEHFLLEYHADFREFWRTAGDVGRELEALVATGLLFRQQEVVLIADDVVPMVWQAIGVDLRDEAAFRLFSNLRGQELTDALSRASVKTSGSKEEKVQRLLTNRVQPRAALREATLESLRDLCRSLAQSAAGAKSELVDRVVEYFAAGASDQDSVEQVDLIPEPRSLNEEQFTRLFESLSGRELANILERFPNLRQSGIKATRVGTLRGSHMSELTLLSALRNRELEEALLRLGDKSSGSKLDRMWRLIERFREYDRPESIIAEPRSMRTHRGREE